MAIVVYNPVEQAEVIGFFETVWLSSFGRIPQEGRDADIFSIEEVYQRNGGQFWIARRENRIIGTVGIQRWNPEIVLLRRLYVLPDFRGRGTGLRLVKTALSYVRQQEVKTIWLWTKHESTEAQRLFMYAGFVEVPSLPVPDAAGKICMELKL